MSTSNNGIVEMEVSPEIFQNLSNLEREFAQVELDALRHKEHNLAKLYVQRSTILSQLPNFWPTVLLNGPQEFQSILCGSSEPDDQDTDGVGSLDLTTISSIKTVDVQRYQIESTTKGEPRSLRFTFEFEKNDIFEDDKIVKEFEYVKTVDSTGDEVGGYVSKPVTFKWTKKGKKIMSVIGCGQNLLDMAVDLYDAEGAAKMPGSKGSKEEVEVTDRVNLWQYEKLRAQIEKIEDKEDEQEVNGGGDLDVEGTWLYWFGYRGAIDLGKEKVDQDKTPMEDGKSEKKADKKEKKQKKDKVQESDGVEDEDEFEGFDLNDDQDADDDDDGLIDVEIFPAGEEVALALAEDLWPNVMDYFMAAQDPLEDDDEDEDIDMIEYDDDNDEEEKDDDEEVPELVKAGRIDVEDLEGRPSKKARTQ